MTYAQARTVLGLSENFSSEELKTQYRKKVLISHPDKNGGDNKKFLLVKQAYELLSLYKENNSIYHAPTGKKKQHTQNVYSQRRQAEQAYKEKFHYTQRRRRTQKNTQPLAEFKKNIRYFLFTLAFLLIFFIFLLLSIRLRAFGVLVYLIIVSVVVSRINFKKFKL